MQRDRALWKWQGETSASARELKRKPSPMAYLLASQQNFLRDHLDPRNIVWLAYQGAGLTGVTWGIRSILQNLDLPSP